MGQRALEILGGLDHPATIHSHFTTSCLNLCWVVLWLSPGTRMFFIEECCPRSTWPLLWPYFVISHSVITNSPWLLATILVCYYQQSWLGSSASQCWCLRHAPALIYWGSAKGGTSSDLMSTFRTKGKFKMCCCQE